MQGTCADCPARISLIMASTGRFFSTDWEGLRKGKQQLEQTLEGTRKDYEAEMARLDAENRGLKTRAGQYTWILENRTSNRRLLVN